MVQDKKTMMTRTYLVYILICVMGVAVLIQAGRVQFLEGDKWKEQAMNATMAVKNIDAIRGNIYSSNGSLLATSIPIYDIYFDPNAPAITDSIFLHSVTPLSKALSARFKTKSWQDYRSELSMARERGKRYHLIKRGVKYNDLQEVKSFPLFEKGRYKGGFIYEQRNKREQPFWPLAARTVGIHRTEGISVGLEGAYNGVLKGVQGRRLMQKIHGGVWMPLNDDNEQDPIPGYDIYTSIDINIQDVAQSALLAQLSEHNADHGCVVVMEVKTGRIKAIANLKRTSEGKYYDTYNYAIGESTEPGSTFKLITLMAALEDGVTDIDEMIDTEDGSVQFYDQVMYDSHRGGYGKISVKRGFEVSSNTLFSKMNWKGYKSDPDKFINRLYNMGVNEMTGVEIPGEGRPLIKNTRDESWSGITLPWMAVGYESRMTPLQILTVYNAVANNGVMVKPRFVDLIKDKGDMIREVETEVLNPSICSEATIQKLQECLRGVVENGTARNLKGGSLAIAGKTGTAQIANDKYGYTYESKISYQASFAGYFPANNPEYSCIVVINAPSNNVYYGNQVAGPIFKEIAEKVYSMELRLHDPVQYSEEEANSRIPYSKSGYTRDLSYLFDELGFETSQVPSSPWVVTTTGSNKIQMDVRKVKPELMPNVTGMGLRDAMFLLENMGAVVRCTGSGTVKKQSVEVGATMYKGIKVKLELE